MNNPNTGVAEKLRVSIRESSGLDEEVCREIAFHMTDWLAEMREFAKLVDDPFAFTSEQTSSIVLRFLLHAPEHIARAAELMTGDPIEGIFSSGP